MCRPFARGKKKPGREVYFFGFTSSLGRFPFPPASRSRFGLTGSGRLTSLLLTPEPRGRGRGEGWEWAGGYVLTYSPQRSRSPMSRCERATVGDQQKRAVGGFALGLFPSLSLLSARTRLFEFEGPPEAPRPFCQCLECGHTQAVIRLGNVWQYGRRGQK